MPESALQTKVIAHLKRKGAYVLNIHGNEFQAGVPDLLCCFKGRFIAIELKYGNNKASKLQAHRITKIQKAGGIAFVAYSTADIDKILVSI